MIMHKSKKHLYIEYRMVHNQLKKFCRSKGLKIGSLIEDLIRLYLNNPKVVQKNIDEIKEV